MLMTSSIKSTDPKKCLVRNGDDKKEHSNKYPLFGKYKVNGNEVGDNEFDDEIGKNKKMSKSKKLSKSKKQ